MVQCFKRIAFGRSMIVDDPVEGHIMPGGRGLLPKGSWRRAHLVGPIRSLVEALRTAQDFADMGPREAGQLGIGNRSNHSVTGLAPGERRRRREKASGGRPKIQQTL